MRPFGKRITCITILVVFPTVACRNESTLPESNQRNSVQSRLPLERRTTLGDFLSEHWAQPIPPQGAPPVQATPIEASLNPNDCGTCHPTQFAQWSTSFHSRAFSPGFSGQLIEGELATPSEIRFCQTCHAPLAEQNPFDATNNAANPVYDTELRTRGVACPVCHLRQHQVFGPPRRPDTQPVPAPVPHSGFTVRNEYLESRFCSPCHQFFDDEGINGKPIENTYVEWQQSPQAAEGKTCQSCHMPDRAHIWRGIHDKEIVRNAVSAELVVSHDSTATLRATLVISNQGVGHMFPSYVTPRVFAAIWQTDASGTEIAGTRVETTIGREINFAAWSEVFDTRIAPGKSIAIEYSKPRVEDATALEARIRVDPDYHYKGVYRYLLGELTDPEALAKIEEAQRRAEEAMYTLAEFHQELP